MQLCSSAWYANSQELDRSNLALQNATYGEIVRKWTDCGVTGEDGQRKAPQRNELRSMMCREDDDEPVVYVLENEDFHVEGELLISSLNMAALPAAHRLVAADMTIGRVGTAGGSVGSV